MKLSSLLIKWESEQNIHTYFLESNTKKLFSRCMQQIEAMFCMVDCPFLSEFNLG